MNFVSFSGGGFSKIIGLSSFSGGCLLLLIRYCPAISRNVSIPMSTTFPATTSNVLTQINRWVLLEDGFLEVAAVFLFLIRFCSTLRALKTSSTSIVYSSQGLFFDFLGWDMMLAMLRLELLRRLLFIPVGTSFFDTESQLFFFEFVVSLGAKNYRNPILTFIYLPFNLSLSTS